MDPLKIYDYLTKARERLFDAVRRLPPQEYQREFPVGLHTIGRTLTHMMITEWAYAQRIQGRDLPPYESWPYPVVHHILRRLRTESIVLPDRNSMEM